MRSALYLLLLTVAMLAVESRSVSAQWVWEQCTTTESGLGVCVVRPLPPPPATIRSRAPIRASSTRHRRR
jgi:hypothetical protein